MSTTRSISNAIRLDGDQFKRYSKRYRTRNEFCIEFEYVAVECGIDQFVEQSVESRSEEEKQRFSPSNKMFFSSFLERRNFSSTGFRNAYESFRRSRDESLTRNSSRKSDEKPSISSSLPTISDEFFNILANFDRPVVIQLKGIYKQVERRNFNEKIFIFFSSKRKPID